CFRLDEGLDLIAERGRLMNSLPDGGTMAAVFGAESDVIPVVEAQGNRVAIAAFNSPTNIVISGDTEVTQPVLEELRSRGIATQRLKVSHAFHSARMERILDEYATIAARVRYRPPQIPLISNLHGMPLAADTALDASYWRQHIRQPVRFQEGVRAV